MFWKKDRAEVEALRKQREDDGRDKEAARLNLQRSLKRLKNALDTVAVGDGVESIASDLGRRS